MNPEKNEIIENSPKDEVSKEESKKYEPKHADKKLDTSKSDSKKADEILKKGMGWNQNEAQDNSKGMGWNEKNEKDFTKKGMGWNQNEAQDNSKGMGWNEKNEKDFTKKGMGWNEDKTRDYSKSMGRNEDSKIDSTKKGMGMIINDENYNNAPRKIKIEGSKLDLLMNDACKKKLESFGLTINSDSKNNGGIEIKGFNGKKLTLNNQTYIAEMLISKDKNENKESIQINILNKNGTKEKYFIKKNGSQNQLVDGNTGKILID